MGCFLHITTHDMEQMESGSVSLPVTMATIASVAPAVVPAALNNIIGRASRSMGLAGEEVAQVLLEEELGLKAVAYSQKGQGFDRVMRNPSNPVVVVEVKTSTRGIPFQQHLGKGYGSKQCSTGWVRAVAQKMVAEGSVNRAIGEAILSNPDHVPVVGVHINPETERADVYIRADSTAQNWTPVVRGVRLR